MTPRVPYEKKNTRRNQCVIVKIQVIEIPIDKGRWIAKPGRDEDHWGPLDSMMETTVPPIWKVNIIYEFPL